MKIRAYIIICLLSASLTACDDNDDITVRFGYGISADGLTMSGDTLVVEQGTDVTFLLNGDPDFITFWSGEPGSDYSDRNRWFIDPGERTWELQFSHYARYGTAIIGALSVYMSIEFEGLTGNDKYTDSLRIVRHEHWIDISEACNMPVSNSQVERPVSLTLDQYIGEDVLAQNKGKKLTLAFIYHPYTNQTAQPSWVVSGLKLVQTSLTDGTSSTVTAPAMGLTPFDMLAESPGDVYLSTNRSGTWNLTNIGADPSQLIMSVTADFLPINYDWLVSEPMIINDRIPDKGLGIKNVSDPPLESYSHNYGQAGTFTFAFLARNENYGGSSEVIRQGFIKVLPVPGYGEEEGEER